MNIYYLKRIRKQYSYYFDQRRVITLDHKNQESRSHWDIEEFLYSHFSDRIVEKLRERKKIRSKRRAFFLAKNEFFRNRPPQPTIKPYSK